VVNNTDTRALKNRDVVEGDFIDWFAMNTKFSTGRQLAMSYVV